MDKETLRKAIPYILIVVAIGMSMYSYIALDSAGDRCNEHYIPQIEKYKLEVERICPMEKFEFLGYGLDVELGKLD